MEEESKKIDEAAEQKEEKKKVEFSAEQQEMINKIIAREIEKVKQKSDKRVAELEEAARLQSMSSEERQKAEIESYKQKIAAYEKDRLVDQFKVELTDKGLPKDFATFIPVDDAEKATAAVKFLSEHIAAVKAPLEKEIEELKQQLTNKGLRGNPPKDVIPAQGESGVEKAFREMNPNLKI